MTLKEGREELRIDSEGPGEMTRREKGG